MSAASPYIPSKDALYDSWSANFSSLIALSPASYGLASGDAAAITAAYAAWHAAYLLVTSPSTKTKATVQAKNTERVNSLAILRPYAQQIANNAGISADTKTAVGVNPRTSVPTPIAAPTTYPTLTISSALPLQHVMRYRDSLASPSVKSKPYGAAAAILFGLPSATVVTDPTTLQFLASNTKSPFLQTWPSGDVGKTAYYAARWITRKGLLGPWGPIVSFVIAG